MGGNKRRSYHTGLKNKKKRLKQEQQKNKPYIPPTLEQVSFFILFFNIFKINSYDDIVISSS